MVKKWIQKSVKHPGALRRQVQREEGSKGFTQRGTIKVATLKKMSHRKGKTGQRARLALKLRGFRED